MVRNAIFVLLSMFKCTLTTIDMNMKEMEYIANSLSPKECKMLSEALHRKSFQLWKPVTGIEEPDDSCLNILLHWDSTLGKGKTFTILALRLKQIGRTDIAERLSKEIYHEESQELHKYFLDDPYKKMIHKNSLLLDNDQPSETAVQAKSEQNVLSGASIAIICLGSASFLLLVYVSFRKLCPGCFYKAWKRVSPDLLVETCDLCCGEIRVCCLRMKHDLNEHLIGAKPQEENVLSLLPEIEA